jgi:hypothetical protein
LGIKWPSGTFATSRAPAAATLASALHLCHEYQAVQTVSEIPHAPKILEQIAAVRCLYSPRDLPVTNKPHVGFSETDELPAVLFHK